MRNLLAINNHRVTEQLRLGAICGGHLIQPPLLKEGCLELVAQDCVQGNLNISKDIISGQPMPVLSNPHSKKVSL